MNKKGAIEITTSMIVVICIGIILLVLGLIFARNLFKTVQEEEFLGPKFYATNEYFNCSNVHTSEFENNKPYFNDAIYATAIEINSEIVYYIDKTMLLQLSKEREEEIVCGRYKPHTYYEDYMPYEGEINRVKTMSCEIGEIGYGYEVYTNRVYYDILCCIESGYCYKYNPKDSYYKDYDYIRCYAKTTRCEKYDE